MERIVYALLSVNPPSEKLNALLVGMKGVSGEGLFVVSYDEISAIVSDIKKVELNADRSNVLQYAEVIDSLAAHFTLLPMRFGSVMESTDAIADMLERNHNEIKLNIQKVDHLYEFGLKVFCDPKTIQAEVIAKSKVDVDSVVKPTRESGNSIFRDYVNRKLTEHRLEESRLRYVESVIREITACISRLNPESKFRKMVTPTTIIDAVFLLEKSKKGELIEVIGDLQNQYTGLNFVLTGPWPPYNFVDFTVK